MKRRGLDECDRAQRKEHFPVDELREGILEKVELLTVHY